MIVRPLAGDSLGTRSMCTMVETGDLTIVIDPGAALGPKRYGLRPHKREWERLKEHEKRIEEASRGADVIVITHYHFDHFPRPSKDVSWLEGKTLLIKDPTRNINYRQRIRSKAFLKKVRGLDVSICIADGYMLEAGNTTIALSDAIPHGNSSKLGYVLEVLIKEGRECLIHTSDVQGIVMRDQLKFIIDNQPSILICDGPMVYMLGNKFSEEDLKSSIKNLKRVILLNSLEKLVLDHHLLRSLDWREHVKPLVEQAKRKGVEVVTLAGLIGKEDDQLEAKRKELYEKEPFDPSEHEHRGERMGMD